MKNLKIYWKNFTFLRRELKYLFFIALFLVLIIELILTRFDEKFKNGYEIGQIILKLSYSYLSALLFYYLVVHYKRQDDKRKFYKFFNDELQKIFIAEGNFYKELRAVNSQAAVDKKDEKQLQQILDKAITNHYTSTIQYDLGKGPYNLQFKVHSEHMYHKISKAISNLLDNKLLMEVEAIDKLLRLKNIDLFKDIEYRLEHKVQYFKSRGPLLVIFFEYIDDLRNYKKNEIDKYLE